MYSFVKCKEKQNVITCKETVFVYRQQVHEIVLSQCGNVFYTIISFTKCWILPHLCLWMTDCFKDVPFIPINDTIVCYQWISLPVEYSKQVFLSIPQLSQSFVVSVPNLFKIRCWHQIQNKQEFTKIKEVDEIYFEVLTTLKRGHSLGSVKVKQWRWKKWEVRT